MPLEYHLGQRICFKGDHRCTVRYEGSVEGTDKGKVWLGVEWDDPKRGKHNGEYGGRRYFYCVSKSPTAASFLNRQKAQPLPEQSFVAAVRQKYATEVTAPTSSSHSTKPIEISGKEVQEVGFDKIRHQQAQLHELRIVLVDGLRIKQATSEDEDIMRDCPKIVELDLSRNLFEGCEAIVSICRQLGDLQGLRLNGNRLDLNRLQSDDAKAAFHVVRTLEMDEMCLSWESILKFAHQFHSLKALTASSNELETLQLPLDPSLRKTPQLAQTLTSLTLEYNQFHSLSDLAPLQLIPSLEKLLLKGNKISRISAEGARNELQFGESLYYVDLAENEISSWDFVDGLAAVFPGMTALRISHNEIYQSDTVEERAPVSLEEPWMLTLARLRNLTSLNYSSISSKERSIAEDYYLKQIAKAMAAVPKESEHKITLQHKRYDELCKIHGVPDVVRKQSETANPGFLESRLVKFTFHMPPDKKSGQEKNTTKRREIPKGFDLYRVKGIVGPMFGIQPRMLKLMWETGARDPVAGYDEKIDGDKSPVPDQHGNTENGRFVAREIELEDGTKTIERYIEGMEATVRVEVKDGVD